MHRRVSRGDQRFAGRAGRGCGTPSGNRKTVRVRSHRARVSRGLNQCAAERRRSNGTIGKRSSWMQVGYFTERPYRWLSEEEILKNGAFFGVSNRFYDREKAADDYHYYLDENCYAE